MRAALFLLAPGLAAIAAPAFAAPTLPVEVSRLRAADAGTALGHGTIVIAAGDPADSGRDSALPVYEAAVADALSRAGYATDGAGPGGGQIAEITLTHDTVQPPEPPHKPVSGAMSTSIGNRGSGFGLALNIDLSKPRGALVSTRLAVRIRDRATNRVLWEGKAETERRETDRDGLDHARVADRLTKALFTGFPGNAQVVAVNAAGQ